MKFYTEKMAQAHKEAERGGAKISVVNKKKHKKMKEQRRGQGRPINEKKKNQQGKRLSDERPRTGQPNQGKGSNVLGPFGVGE